MGGGATREGQRMKLLVTGGGGFLGQALCRALLAHGHEVASFSRSRHAALDALGVRQLQGDLADREAVLAAFAEGFDAVLHNAAKAGTWGSYQSYFDANVTGIQVVLEAGIAVLARRDEPTAAPPSRLTDEVLVGIDRVGVLAPDPLAAAGPLAGLVIGSAVCRVGVRLLLEDPLLDRLVLALLVGSRAVGVGAARTVRRGVALVKHVVDAPVDERVTRLQLGLVVDRPHLQVVANALFVEGKVVGAHVATLPLPPQEVNASPAAARVPNLTDRPS